MNNYHLKVSVGKQAMDVLVNDEVQKTYKISTAINGLGQKVNSECTPTGRHKVCAKIGSQAPRNSVFVARRRSGEEYSPQLACEAPGRDWILTRILWLSGQEEGHNRGAGVDTLQRYIYIHGSPDDAEMGKPGSRGCIRMANDDIIELFNLINVGSSVLIES